jgi:hypothetical protein
MGYSQLPDIPLAVKDTVLETAPGPSVHKWSCPACPISFCRLQEQKRHIMTHLPQWIYCPEPGCSWRGDRPDALKRHWRAMHHSNSQEPDNGFRIYDPEPLIKGIINGLISIGEAQSAARSMVSSRAQELGKWGNLSGRRRARRHSVDNPGDHSHHSIPLPHMNDKHSPLLGTPSLPGMPPLLGTPSLPGMPPLPGTPPLLGMSDISPSSQLGVCEPSGVQVSSMRVHGDVPCWTERA